MFSSKRRTFLKYVAIIGIGTLLPTSTASSLFFRNICTGVNSAIRLVIQIIENLKKEGSSIVSKTLNGKKLVRDEDTHYPNEDSIEDTKTACQIFFHSHRENEYGHFHTFIKNAKGELVHLIMISMDEKGKPVALSTLNTWVTGEVYINANDLKRLFLQFKMSHVLFPDKRIIEFVENIFIGYKDLIYGLFDERDQFIQKYIAQNGTEPFEDKGFEVLSSLQIDIYKDAL